MGKLHCRTAEKSLACSPFGVEGHASIGLTCHLMYVRIHICRVTQGDGGE